MTFKILGAILTIVGCGGFGLQMAVQYHRQVAALEQLLVALTYMHCELQYRLTPLPALCKQTSTVTTGCISVFFQELSQGLSRQLSPIVKDCVESALIKTQIPPLAAKALHLLGDTLGSFDVSGQLQGICAVKENAENALSQCVNHQQVCIRSYQTLSLCAGAALAILFI